MERETQERRIVGAIGFAIGWMLGKLWYLLPLALFAYAIARRI